MQFLNRVVDERSLPPEEAEKPRLTQGRRRFYMIVALAMGFCGVVGVYLLTMPGGHGAMAPANAFISARYAEATTAMQFDRFGRLVSDFRKTEVPCPKQDEKTVVILALGQSNAANTSTQRFVSMHGNKIINYFQGHCMVAQSPLLGATGNGGEQWTALGNELIENGGYGRVIIIPAAINGSAAKQWSDGDLRTVLDDTLLSLKDAYVPTIVIWHQGEADFFFETSESEYREEVTKVARRVRENGVMAPFFITVSTRCTPAPQKWEADNPVARAQHNLVNPELGIFAGVDADSALTRNDRYDGCHLSRTGVTKLADAWAALIGTRR